jgi:hypothetical protein
MMDEAAEKAFNARKYADLGRSPRPTDRSIKIQAFPHSLGRYQTLSG